MNPEKVEQLPKRMHKDPQALANICANLAMKLSGGRWHETEIRNAELERLVTDQIGDDIEINERLLSPTYTTLRVEFAAAKSTGRFEDDDDDISGEDDSDSDPDDNDMLDITTYRVRMGVRQTVEEVEVPSNVLDEIFEDADDDDHDHDHGIGDSVMDIVERDDLDEIEIEREIFVEYGVDQEGHVDDYALMHSYYFEDQKVHEVFYTQEQGVRITAPVSYAGSPGSTDRRPAIVSKMNEHSIAADAANIDESWNEFRFAEDVKSMLEFGAQNQEDHRRQALAILGLVTSGLFSMRSLAKPVSWRERAKLRVLTYLGK